MNNASYYNIPAAYYCARDFDSGPEKETGILKARASEVENLLTEIQKSDCHRIYHKLVYSYPIPDADREEIEMCHLFRLLPGRGCIFDLSGDHCRLDRTKQGLADLQTNKFVAIKCTEILSDFMMDLLFVLSACFGKMHVVQLNIQNPTSGEKYVVCTEARENGPRFLNAALSKAGEKNILRTMVPLSFRTKLEEISALATQQQLQSMQFIYSLALSGKTDKVRIFLEETSKRIKDWDQTHLSRD